MRDIIRSDQRHHFETDWLSAYWHFSFDHYYDPNNMSWGPLRVFNNDTIQPAKGFPMHPHRDMEILSYVTRGELEHKDNTGGHGMIHAGEIQRMSAGTGIVHSEFNASQTDPCELVQIWVLPANKGVEPSYEQKQFTKQDRAGKLLPIASGDLLPNTVKVGQDVTFYVAGLSAGNQVKQPFDPKRLGYLFVLDGAAQLNGDTISKGDSVKLSQEPELRLSTTTGADVLLIDLP